jgi:2-phospho-L-lactate guanylyltransferase
VPERGCGDQDGRRRAPDQRPDGLNPALRQAQQVADSAHATGLLIVPADLPTLAREDVDAILAAAISAPVAIAPDRAGQGTNALLLRPVLAIDPSFGLDSFARHRLLAEEAGLTAAVVQRPGLALDLDTPADVVRLLAGNAESPVTRLLRALGVEGRLERFDLPQARSATI